MRGDPLDGSDATGAAPNLGGLQGPSNLQPIDLSSVEPQALQRWQQTLHEYWAAVIDRDLPKVAEKVNERVLGVPRYCASLRQRLFALAEMRFQEGAQELGREFFAAIGDVETEGTFEDNYAMYEQVTDGPQVMATIGQAVIVNLATGFVEEKVKDLVLDKEKEIAEEVA